MVDVTEGDCSVAKNYDAAEVSFILNIFPNGYSIVNPSEDERGVLHPYDRRSESLITAIECGHLPVDFLDGIHCKYINGTVLCEVRDYRRKSCVSAVDNSLTAAVPSVIRVSLKMSLDNVAKDIPRIAENTWDYGDLLEAESRILYALQPKLCLDPTPNLDRLCKEPTSVKLNLDIRGKRLERLRQGFTPENSASGLRDSREVMARPHLGNQVVRNFGQSNMIATEFKNHAPESSSMRVGNSIWMTGQPDFVNQIEKNVGKSIMIAAGPKNHAPDTNISSVSHQSSHQVGAGNLLSMHIHATDINSSSVMSSVNDKRGNHRQVPSMGNSNKRGRSTHAGRDGNQHIDSINACAYRLKHTQLQQPPTIQQINDLIFNQYNVEQETVKTGKINNFDPNSRVPQQFTRYNFHKAPWNNMDPNLESSTIGKEFSSGSGGLQFGASATSVPVIGETRSLTFNADESMQQAQMAANWRSNTQQMSPVISGSGSSSSVGNMIGPFTVSSTMDSSMQDRFFKIQMLTARFKLNRKENKIDEYKPTKTFPTQQLKDALFNDDIFEDRTCEMPLSKSLMGGNINTCKTRVLNFVQNEPLLPENGLLVIPKVHTRMILSERQSDGTVVMHHGELDGVDYLADEHLLPTLPNTHMADLLAAQFCILMFHEGYQQAGDHLKPKPISMVQSTGGQQNTTTEDFNNWLQKILESDPSKSNFEIATLIYEAAVPIGEARRHNMHPQRIVSFPGVSTTRMHPHMVNTRESQLQNQFLHQRELTQIRRGMMMRPDSTGHGNGGNNYNGIGFVGLGMGGDRHAGAGVVSPMSQNPMAKKQKMGQNNTNGSGGLVGQSSNCAKRQIHPGSGSGSVPSDVSMLGFGTGVNRVNDMNRMPRSVTAPPNLLSLNPNQNQNQIRYINQQQQFQLYEPTSQSQAVLFPSQQAGSPSSSIRRPRARPPPANSLSPQNLDFTRK
ncbi:hypothetical protein QVD17_02708 [Tagetes erecta]|uniref:Uncharacterized protein n=1 Tax=Tagetes erecta TaxID=13708 RepID=A0AAD8P933_TARER|nr:hypothetical protein QVD17_02708 [Tagetes erecta]